MSFSGCDLTERGGWLFVRIESEASIALYPTGLPYRGFNKSFPGFYMPHPLSDVGNGEFVAFDAPKPLRFMLEHGARTTAAFTEMKKR